MFKYPLLDDAYDRLKGKAMINLNYGGEANE